MEKLIYIVDDEPNIRQLISVALKDDGFETRNYSDGTSLLAAVRKKTPDLIILDWMMPAPDGMAVCKTLRSDKSTRQISIIMLTARSGEVDRILGLEMGADDYIVKPFSVKELCARVRAVLRRKDYLSEESAEIIARGRLKADIAGRKIFVDDIPIELTMKEFDLLVMLMKNQGRVLTRDALLDKVWGVEYFGDARTVDVHIRYLRQKLEAADSETKYIQTLRGVGYRFASEEDLL